MKLAWKEIRHNKKKYALIEGVLVLMVFMVLFLSGLASGLARAVSAVIEIQPAAYYAVSEDSEKLLNLSKLDEDKIEQIKLQTSQKVAPFNVQRMNLNRIGDSTKIDVSYVALEEGSFLSPKITEGNSLDFSKTDIVLNETFKEEGIKLGDEVEDSATGTRFRVVGFTKGAYYGHVAAGYISTQSYQKILQTVNPNAQKFYHGVAIEGNELDEIQVPGVEIVEKAEIISNIPGYSAEQTTINMIVWVLVVISAAILGVFFYIITIQKEKQFGVLKAIGMPMSKITQMIIGQVLILTCVSVVAGNLITWGMSLMLPPAMPFYLKEGQAILVSVVFIVVSVVCSVFSTIKVSNVDPMISIGGRE